TTAMPSGELLDDLWPAPFQSWTSPVRQFAELTCVVNYSLAVASQITQHFLVGGGAVGPPACSKGSTQLRLQWPIRGTMQYPMIRSEERRVGKEWRARELVDR